MFKYKKVLFLHALFFWQVFSNAQVSYHEIESKFNQYRLTHLQEKIFMHSDKQFYLPGEIIWFKIYVVDASFHSAIDISKICYVELINSDKKSTLQGKIALTNGSGSGSFMLPSSIPSGNYLLRAYTHWMKNFSAGFYFEKSITIINPQKPPRWPVQTDSTLFDIQFFPEGGNLVNGLESKVAFKITDPNGRGVPCTGVIVNEKNDTLVNFNTLQFGMGNFLLTPSVNSRYRALVNVENKKLITKTLPAVHTSGLTMQVQETDSGFVKILVKSADITPGLSVFLFAQTRQVKKIGQMQVLVNGRAEFKLTKNQFGEGITQFTLFDHQLQPVCERLFFRRPEQKLLIHAKTDQPEYAARKKVTIQLKATNNRNTPVPVNLSMGVYLVDSLQKADESNILNYFFLDADLKGKIESPGYYLNNTGPVANEALDNLMLTHGWRRFIWSSVLENKTPDFSFLPELEGPLITARTINAKTKLPIPNIPVSLSVPGAVFQLSDAVSNNKGEAIFNLKPFYGANEPILHTNAASIQVEMVNPFSEQFSSTTIAPLDLNKKWKQLLLARSIDAQTENIYHGTEKQQFYLPYLIDSNAFYGRPYKKYLLDDYTRFLTITEIIQEYIPELRLKRVGNGNQFQVLNIPYKSFFEREPLLLLDGVPVTNTEKLLRFDPLKIKQIEVLAGKYYRMGVIDEGIINFTTYEGDLSGYELDSGSLVIPYEGMQFQREFYSPLYETTEQQESRLPDFRNVLYWSPEIKTDTNGEVQLSFYNSDVSGRYAIVINATNHSGLVGGYTCFFSVKK
jgi:hypothetical protein